MDSNRKQTSGSSNQIELVRLDTVEMDEDDEILPDFEAEVDGQRVWVTAVLERTVVVEPAPGYAATSELAADLLSHCTTLLAKYKCPRSIDFTETMPRDPNGKLYKRRLRDPYWERSGREV